MGDRLHRNGSNVTATCIYTQGMTSESAFSCPISHAEHMVVCSVCDTTDGLSASASQLSPCGFSYSVRSYVAHCA